MESSEDLDKMSHKAAFHCNLHCLLRRLQPLGTEIHQFIEFSTCHLLKYKRNKYILILSKSISMGQKSKRHNNVTTISSIGTGILSLSLNLWLICALTRYRVRIQTVDIARVAMLVVVSRSIM